MAKKETVSKIRSSTCTSNLDETILSIKISEIKIKKELWPRIKYSPESTERYRTSYENYEELPPLIANSDYILIDGMHRLRALKQLERKQASVWIMNIPESDIFSEAVKRNKNHGTPFTKEERNEQIWYLKHEDDKTGKEVAQIVGLTESQVSRIYKDQLRLRNLSPQDAKDQRKKVSKEDVLAKLKSGDRPIDIANDMGITIARVSQIRSLLTDNEKVIAYCDPEDFKQIFKTVFDGFDGTAEFKFYKEMLIVETCTSLSYRLAYFSSDYFPHYDVDKEFTWKVSSSILGSVTHYCKKSIESIAFTVKESQNETSFSFTSESMGSFTPGELYFDEVPPLPDLLGKLNNKGLPEKNDASFSIDSKELTGILNTTKYRMNVKRTYLELMGETKSGWSFRKEIPINDFIGEEMSIEVPGDLKDLMNIKSFSKHVITIDKKSKIIGINVNGKRFWALTALYIKANKSS